MTALFIRRDQGARALPIASPPAGEGVARSATGGGNCGLAETAVCTRPEFILPRATGEDEWSAISESSASSDRPRRAASKRRSERGPPHG